MTQQINYESVRAWVPVFLKKAYATTDELKRERQLLNAARAMALSYGGQR